jgi:hypothetical protein
MIRQNWPLLVALTAGLIAGCDNPKASTFKPGSASTTQPTTVPSTQPVSVAPATQPAPEPATSQLTIDGKVYKFAPAKLLVNKTGNHVIARLYTDDPKSALEDDYKGNNYDLQMRLDDIHDPQQVYMSVWQYKAPSREYVNAPYGIFLDGLRYQLQPLDVTARFLGTMTMVQVSLDGPFLMFDDSDKSGAPKVVHVQGSLLAPVEYKD